MAASVVATSGATATIDEEPPPDMMTSNVPMLILLAHLFDFQKEQQCTRDGWERGAAALQFCAPGDDERSWARLTELFGRKDGTVHFDDLEGMLPVDPRIVSVLSLIVQAVASHADAFSRVAAAAAASAAAAAEAASAAAAAAASPAAADEAAAAVASSGSRPATSRPGSARRPSRPGSAGAEWNAPPPLSTPDGADALLANALSEALSPANCSVYGSAGPGTPRQRSRMGSQRASRRPSAIIPLTGAYGDASDESPPQLLEGDGSRALSPVPPMGAELLERGGVLRSVMLRMSEWQRRCFAAWRDLIDERREKLRQLLTTGLAARLRGALAAHFGAWRKLQAEQSAHERARRQRAALFFVRGSELRALRAWRDLAEAQRALKAAWLRAQRQTVSAAVARWRRDAHVGQTARRADERRQRALCARALGRWSLFGKREAGRLDQAAERCARLVADLKLGRRLGSWRDACRRMRRLRFRTYARGSLLGLAWRGWVAARERQRSERQLLWLQERVLRSTRDEVMPWLERSADEIGAAMSAKMADGLATKAEAAEVAPLRAQISEIAMTRVHRHELEGVRREIHTFLFRDMGLAKEEQRLSKLRDAVAADAELDFLAQASLAQEGGGGRFPRLGSARGPRSKGAAAAAAAQQMQQQQAAARRSAVAALGTAAAPPPQPPPPQPWTPQPPNPPRPPATAASAPTHRPPEESPLYPHPPAGSAKPPPRVSHRLSSSSAVEDESQMWGGLIETAELSRRQSELSGRQSERQSERSGSVSAQQPPPT